MEQTGGSLQGAAAKGQEFRDRIKNWRFSLALKAYCTMAVDWEQRVDSAQFLNDLAEAMREPGA